MSRRVGLSVAAILFLTGFSAADDKTPNFQTEVLPLLKSRCVQCHGPAKQEGQLSLALPQGIKRGGETGPAVHPGDPQQSLLWQRVEAGEMPPDAPLPADEQSLLKRWIAGGAPGLPATISAKPDGDEHWAFQPLTVIEVPDVADGQARTAIDRFILEKLRPIGLTIGPEASREVLIRRVAFDLTGLPPTIEEIDRYLNDASATAYEQMVERYLSSERYGERWGKYWLDAAGYADSNGYFGADTDRPLAYRYRDYVIRSINADKPWDQFIREQLAGDELAGYRRGGDVSTDMIELLTAAHFIRNSPDGTDSSDGNPDEVRADKYAVLEGAQQIIGTSLFGLTVQCARCHDHKFEPFTQQDYYRLQAVIFPALNVDQWVKPKDRDITLATAAQIAEWQSQVKEIDDQIAQRRQTFTEWAKQNRERGRELFADAFESLRPLTELWSSSVPGDETPAGTPAVMLDQKSAPAAESSQGSLHIIESGGSGDRAVSTRQVFDWTPHEKGGWVQVTFDLVSGGDTALYVGFLIALKDFNDAAPQKGGNVLFDGAAAGQAGVYVDYPGVDSRGVGKIGKSGFTPGRNYGVRITNLGEGKFEARLMVDGVPEEQTVTLSAADLPDGGFGFEYCCGRSFVVDNVLIEESAAPSELTGEAQRLAEMYEQQRRDLEAAVKELESRKPSPLDRLASVSDQDATPPEVKLLVRGDYKHPGEAVTAGAPHALSEDKNPAEFVITTQGDRRSTGRRLALANWITRPDSRAAALLARVTVNRWWQHHFGTGIVATVDNLGYSGSPPSHPELLDYLAAELVRQNWSAKAVHRAILHSAAYRQASAVNAENERLDPDSRLLSRFPLRRLDGEAIRDAMLAVSGDLNPQMYGPYVPTQRSGEGDVVVSEDDPGSKRRSVYLQQRRTQVLGLLEAFDAPSITFNCTARPQTTVPLQSLKLLNSGFVRNRAKGLARRVLAHGEADGQTGIHVAFRIAWGRQPTETELRTAREFLNDQPAEYAGQANAVEMAWTDFCQMLLAANAFLYLE